MAKLALLHRLGGHSIRKWVNSKHIAHDSKTAVRWSSRDTTCDGASSKDGDLTSTERDTKKMKTGTTDEDIPVSTTQITNFLHNSKMKYGARFTGFITTCPIHSPESGHRTQIIDYIDKLYINMETGWFECKSCGKSGPWNALKQNIEQIVSATESDEPLERCFQNVKLPQHARRKMYEDHVLGCTPVANVSDEKLRELLTALEMQAITRETLVKFEARVDEKEAMLVLPYKSMSGDEVVAYTSVSVEPFYNKQKVKARFFGSHKPQTMFGVQTLSRYDDQFVLVEDERDAMAVYQATRRPVLATPKSALPQQVLPRLEGVEKIVIWPQDTSQNTGTYCRKLHEARCHVVRRAKTDPSPLKCLQNKQDLKAILADARIAANGHIVSFADLREEVWSDITDTDSLSGVQWTRFTKLNTLLRGHRSGELTIFTGPTGAGKTTFMSEYSLDLCASGVNTLWGSFEVNNKKLMRTMLRQLSGINIEENPQHFAAWADQFEQLGLYFMTFHGQQNIDQVIETMAHAVYVKDISHVIVDNLQFMMGSDNLGDRFAQQDAIISRFRRFATAKDCHVTLVVHPRKEREEELTLQSIFGGAKVTQEADNVLILQKMRLESKNTNRKFIEVVKNRYEGSLGIMPLRFNRDSLCFSYPEKTEQKNKQVKQGDSADSNTPPTVELHDTTAIRHAFGQEDAGSGGGGGGGGDCGEAM